MSSDVRCRNAVPILHIAGEVEAEPAGGGETGGRISTVDLGGVGGVCLGGCGDCKI